jgi:DNA-binding IclR family transcriptional regulator
VSAEELEHIRAMSEVLFGQRYRLEAMLAIASAEDGLVCLTDLAQQLEIPPSNLQSSLRDLARCGLLSRLPPDGSKRRYYQRNESLAWAFAKEMASHADRLRLVSERTW